MDTQDPINGVYIGLAPFPVIVENKGLQGSPTKHVKILVVTIPGKGDNPIADPLDWNHETIAGKGTLGTLGVHRTLNSSSFFGKDHEVLVVIYFINESSGLFFSMVGLTSRVCIKKEYAANG